MVAALLPSLLSVAVVPQHQPHGAAGTGGRGRAAVAHETTAGNGQRLHLSFLSRRLEMAFHLVRHRNGSSGSTSSISGEGGQRSLPYNQLGSSF